MGYKWMVILLLGLSVLTSSSVTHGVEVDSISRKKILEVEKKLNILNKHAVKSIQSEDGDIIDCIHIYKQPAFDHPALRNHTIQMAPSSPPTMKATTTMKEGKGDSSVTITSQLWQKSGTCPEGTIPIRRIRKEDLLKANVANEYGRKMPRFSQRFKHLDNNINSYLQQENHSVRIQVKAKYLVSLFYPGGI
ncbi:uncharacterized protein LOC130765448 [Actinidia eriantha]|uniref:uncharacterized protein LOC130765448 n=1 Tax=Actinidia eriantha TaxID=165200 RepID=UPI0025874A6E|nr:uncharacterized protein LOC130765448 [Actinidia eriantha]